MTTFLLILQVVSGLFAAGAAVASLLKSKGIEEIKTPSIIIGGTETVVRRLTREAKIGIYCVSVGLIISFAARITERYITNKRNAEVQAVMSDQLRRTEESLNYLERLATRFDTLSFSVTYKLTTNDVCFALLNEYLSDHFPTRLNAQSGTMKTNSFAQSRPTSLFDNIFNPQKGNLRTNRPVYSQQIVGYLNTRIGTNSHKFDLTLSSDASALSFILSKEDLLAILSSFSTNSTNNDLPDFFFNPQVYLKLVAAKSPETYKGNSVLPSMIMDAIKLNSNRFGAGMGKNRKIVSEDMKDMIYNALLSANFKASEKGDLFVLATNRSQMVRFTFTPASKELLVHLTFDCPKAGWEQTKWMSSLPDLSYASLFLGVTNTLQGLVVPVSGRFTFDLTSVTTTNFSPINSPSWRGWKLPSKREIMGMR